MSQKNTLKLFDPKFSSQPLKKLTAMLAKRGKNTIFWTLFTPSSLKLLKQPKLLKKSFPFLNFNFITFVPEHLYLTNTIKNIRDTQ